MVEVEDTGSESRRSSKTRTEGSVGEVGDFVNGLFGLFRGAGVGPLLILGDGVGFGWGAVELSGTAGSGSCRLSVTGDLLTTGDLLLGSTATCTSLVGSRGDGFLFFDGGIRGSGFFFPPSFGFAGGMDGRGLVDNRVSDVI